MMEKGTRLVQIQRSSLQQQGQGEHNKKKDIDDIQFSLNQVKSLIEGKLSSFQKFLESNQTFASQQQFFENTFASNKILETHINEILDVCHFNMNKEEQQQEKTKSQFNQQDIVPSFLQQKPIQKQQDQANTQESITEIEFLKFKKKQFRSNSDEKSSGVRFNDNIVQTYQHDEQSNNTFVDYQQAPIFPHPFTEQQEQVYHHDKIVEEEGEEYYDDEMGDDYQEFQGEGDINDQYNYEQYPHQIPQEDYSSNQLPIYNNQPRQYQMGNYNHQSNQNNQYYPQDYFQQMLNYQNHPNQQPIYNQQFQRPQKQMQNTNQMYNHQIQNPTQTNYQPQNFGYSEDTRQYHPNEQNHNGYVNSFNYQQKRAPGQPLRNKLEQEQRLELYRKFEQEHNIQIPKFFKSQFYLQKTPRSRFFQHLTINEFYVVAQIYEKLGTQQQVAELLDTSVPNVKRILTTVKQQIESGQIQNNNNFQILYQQIK